MALRVQARLPLDDVYIAIEDLIPQLTRSSLHRCLQRHGISCLARPDGEEPKKFKDYEIGYFHIDIANDATKTVRRSSMSPWTAPRSSSSAASTARPPSSPPQDSRRRLADRLQLRKQLKALKFTTPYQAIDELWKSSPMPLAFSQTITSWNQTPR